MDHTTLPCGSCFLVMSHRALTSLESAGHWCKQAREVPISAHLLSFLQRGFCFCTTSECLQPSLQDQPADTSRTLESRDANETGTGYSVGDVLFPPVKVQQDYFSL